MRATVAALTLLACFPSSNFVWAGACEEKCRNADYLSATLYHAVKQPAPGNTIEFFRRGLSAGIPQPGGAAFNVPALRSFGGKLFLVVRGADGNNGVWVNTFSGSAWSGWQSIGLTINSPDLTVYASKLFLAVAGVDNGMYVNRYTSSWLGWQVLGGFLTDALCCSGSSQIRAGGTGGDNQCYRKTSGDGVTWSGWTVAPPCP